MEAFWQFLMDISARHITPHGLYIPGETYKLILWNELLVILLSFTMTILWLKNRALKRRLAKERCRESKPLYKPSPFIRECHYKGKRVSLEDVNKIIEKYDFIQIKYIDFKGNITERTIEVYEIFQNDGHWYLEAFCWLRCEGRSFRVDRIIEIKAVEDEPHTLSVGENPSPPAPLPLKIEERRGE